MIEVIDGNGGSPPCAKSAGLRVYPQAVVTSAIDSRIFASGSVQCCFLHLTNMRRAGIRVLQVLLLTMPAAAQQISTHVNLVPVLTLVLDGDGNTIFGLHAQDFMDDGVQQVVHLDEDAESKPLSLMVAVQCGRRANREFGRIIGISTMLDPIFESAKQRSRCALL